MGRDLLMVQIPFLMGFGLEFLFEYLFENLLVSYNKNCGTKLIEYQKVEAKKKPLYGAFITYLKTSTWPEYSNLLSLLGSFASIVQV